MIKWAVSDVATVKTVSFGKCPMQSVWRYEGEGIATYGRVMPDLADIVARNVRAERARIGWRQKDLAERIGWSIGMVSDTESGKRRIGVSDLPLLCRALGVPLSELLKGANPDDLTALDVN
jgi:ribosome-binding protein aMBF1 (putative translation factor)